MTAKNALLDVRDLSVAFAAGGKEMLAVDRVSFRIGKGETVALVGESGSGKTVSALSILKLLPYPPASHPSGEVWFEGRDLLEDLRAAAAGDPRRPHHHDLPGADDLAQPAAHDRAADRRGPAAAPAHGRASAGAARVLELLHKVGIREPEKRLGAYPAPAVGRPAPARHDRHGARQRARPADRRRADDRARRHHPGADPRAAHSSCRREIGMAMLFITHDLGIVRKMADRVYVMQGGKIVETGADRGDLHRRRSIAYTKHLLAAEPKGTPPAADDAAPVVVETDDLKVWFPIKKGLLRRTRRLREGGRRASTSSCAPGRRSASSANRARARRRSASRILRLISSQGPIAYVGKRIDGLSLNARCGRCARTCRSSSRTRTARCRRACRSAQIIEEGLLIQKPELDYAERARARRRTR